MQTMHKYIKLHVNEGHTQQDAIFNFSDAAHLNTTTNLSSPKRHMVAPSTNEPSTSLQNHRSDHNNPGGKDDGPVKINYRCCLIKSSLSNEPTINSSAHSSMNAARMQYLFSTATFNGPVHFQFEANKKH